MRQAPGPSTRIDITGAFFSMAAPAPVPRHDRAPPPRARPMSSRRARQRRPRGRVHARRRADRSQRVAVHVEPGKFTYRLVRAELEFTEYGTVEAHCRIGQGPFTVVPITLAPAGLRTTPMPFAAALSEHPLATHAHRRGRRRGARPARASTDGEPVDLAVVFVTAPHVGVLEDVASTVRALLHPRALDRRLGRLGARGTPTRPRRSPAMSLFAARRATTLAVRLTRCGLRRGRRRRVVGGGLAPRRRRRRAARCSSSPTRSACLHARRPDDDRRASARTSRSIGGMASAAQGPGGNRLVLDDRRRHDGAVGVAARPRRADRARSSPRDAGRSVSR